MGSEAHAPMCECHHLCGGTCRTGEAFGPGRPCHGPHPYVDPRCVVVQAALDAAIDAARQEGFLAGYAKSQQDEADIRALARGKEGR